MAGSSRRSERSSATGVRGRANSGVGGTGRGGGAGRAEPFADYAAAMAYLSSHTNLEQSRPGQIEPGVFKLDRMRAMAQAAGNPQRAVRFVHVAGSKGKGSVCEMLASVLGASGYTVGLYTSPHLVTLRERIRVGGEMISEAALAGVMSRVRGAASAVERAHGPATYFELLTMAGLLHFAEQAVDIAVMEVGLGGRLDSTNIITPLACGLTAIQLEHTQVLGSTLELIAAEKAGIMKPGVPAISVPQAPGVLGVFRERALAVGAPLSVLGEEIEYSVRFESAHAMGPHMRVCVGRPGGGAFEHLPSPLPGEHQGANCGLTLALVDVLRGLGFACPEAMVTAGLAATPRRGRLERVWERPRVMIDGAHTRESVAGLLRALGTTEKFDSLVVIFGCAADKDVEGMLEELGRGADKVIFTRASNNPRAADPARLARRFEAMTEKAAGVEPDVRSAINAAAKGVGRGDLIVVTGSFYVAGEAKGLFEAKRAGAGGAVNGPGAVGVS